MSSYLALKQLQCVFKSLYVNKHGECEQILSSTLSAAIRLQDRPERQDEIFNSLQQPSYFGYFPNWIVLLCEASHARVNALRPYLERALCAILSEPTSIPYESNVVLGRSNDYLATVFHYLCKQADYMHLKPQRWISVFTYVFETPALSKRLLCSAEFAGFLLTSSSSSTFSDIFWKYAVGMGFDHPCWYLCEEFLLSFWHRHLNANLHLETVAGIVTDIRNRTQTYLKKLLMITCELQLFPQPVRTMVLTYNINPNIDVYVPLFDAWRQSRRMFGSVHSFGDFPRSSGGWKTSMTSDQPWFANTNDWFRISDDFLTQKLLLENLEAIVGAELKRAETKDAHGVSLSVRDMLRMSVS